MFYKKVKYKTELTQTIDWAQLPHAVVNTSDQPRKIAEKFANEWDAKKGKLFSVRIESMSGDPIAEYGMNYIQ